MKAIIKRELKAYFTSVIGWVFLAAFLFIFNLYFWVYNLNMAYAYISYALSGSAFVFLIIIPVLTMRSLAEERKNRTDQLLLTRPVTLGQIVLGKYLAMVTILAIPCLVFCMFPLVIQGQGTAYLKTDYAAILIYFLLGCTYIALGLLLSALTESPVIAAVSTFGVLLVCYLWEGLRQFMPSQALANLAVILALIVILAFWVKHMTKNWMLASGLGVAAAAACGIVFLNDSTAFENLLSEFMGHFAFAALLEDALYNNLLNVQGILLLLSAIGLCLFLTMQMIQKRRWN